MRRCAGHVPVPPAGSPPHKASGRRPTEEPAMRAARISGRSLVYGLVVVILAMTGLALLSEALAKGGSTVYLANITAGSGSVPTEPSIVVTGSGRATAPAER